MFGRKIAVLMVLVLSVPVGALEYDKHLESFNLAMEKKLKDKFEKKLEDDLRSLGSK
ncbi:hypothetical protein [Vibrio barjaei]|uniref:hypothetical protein n=1 Tax=Vibrio barjaei TaxID=1676683 RepID=UPI0022833CA5|nr:hypothetical protein [Vibrio barjaei]MCY9870409.1 hypothetical protein [Vibrio barjaei]